MSLQWKCLCPLPRKGCLQIEFTNPAFRHSETVVEDVVISRCLATDVRADSDIQTF
jgi:hypothetical protein